MRNAPQFRVNARSSKVLSASMVKIGGVQTLLFTYDYLGRRVRKQVTGTDASDTKYVYAGWKLIAELESNAVTPRRAFVWGPDYQDARGSGAGAGSLLAQIDARGVSYAMTDHHGSVVGYIDSTGTVIVARHFDAMGQAKAFDSNGQKTTTYVYSGKGTERDYPFGFSGQYTDAETQLVYYGLRYYQPKHGRFINRDPIREAGGYNLYALCGNQGVGAWDLLGCLDYEESIAEDGAITRTYFDYTDAGPEYFGTFEYGSLADANSHFHDMASAMSSFGMDFELPGSTPRGMDAVMQSALEISSDLGFVSPFMDDILRAERLLKEADSEYGTFDEKKKGEKKAVVKIGNLRYWDEATGAWVEMKGTGEDIAMMSEGSGSGGDKTLAGARYTQNEYEAAFGPPGSPYERPRMSLPNDCAAAAASTLLGPDMNGRYESVAYVATKMALYGKFPVTNFVYPGVDREQVQNGLDGLFQERGAMVDVSSVSGSNYGNSSIPSLMTGESIMVRIKNAFRPGHYVVVDYRDGTDGSGGIIPGFIVRDPALDSDHVISPSELWDLVKYRSPGGSYKERVVVKKRRK